MSVDKKLILNIAAIVLISGYMAFFEDDLTTQESVRRPAQGTEEDGIFNPRRQKLMPRIHIESGGTTFANRSGSAFAVSPYGHYLTSKHVVDGCKKVHIIRERDNLISSGEVLTIAPYQDLALIKTKLERAPFELPENNVVPDKAYGIGYPSGIAGELSAHKLHQVKVNHRGVQRDELSIAWAVQSHTPGIKTFSGFSGGPMISASGELVGVNMAASKSIRRGRFYTNHPLSIDEFLQSSLTQTMPEEGSTLDFTEDNYAQAAENLRLEDRVTRILCKNI